MSRNIYLILALATCSSLSVGCYKKQPPPPAQRVVVEMPPVPEGTERYCWMEPKVSKEKNGPGLDEQGHWYHPPYAAIREVKMGRWIPCNKIADNRF